MSRVALAHLLMEFVILAVVWHEYGWLPACIWLFSAYRWEGIDFILRVLGKSGIVTQRHIEKAMGVGDE